MSLLSAIIDAYFANKDDVANVCLANKDDFARFFFINVGNIKYYRGTMELLERANYVELARLWLRIEWMPIFAFHYGDSPRDDLSAKYCAMWDSIRTNPRINGRLFVECDTARRKTLFAHYSGNSESDIILYCEQYTRELLTQLYGSTRVGEFFAKHCAHHMLLTARNWSLCAEPLNELIFIDSQVGKCIYCSTSDASRAIAYIPRDFNYSLVCSRLRAILRVPCDPSRAVQLPHERAIAVNIDEDAQMQLSRILSRVSSREFVQCCMWRFVAGYSGSASARIFSVGTRLIMLDENPGATNQPDARIRQLFNANRVYLAAVAREWSSQLEQLLPLAINREFARIDGFNGITSVQITPGLISNLAFRANYLATDARCWE